MSDRVAIESNPALFRNAGNQADRSVIAVMNYTEMEAKVRMPVLPAHINPILPR